MGPQSKYHQHKSQAIESFIRFSEGLELPQRPLTMYVEVSNLCDLQCAMCPTFSAINPERIESIKYKKRELLDIEDIAQLAPYLESALQVHAFGYGEPTIHPDFLKILDTLKTYEVMVDFFTNGMHLTDENCRAIVDSRVSAITISFSGSTKEEYENVYIKGDFDVVMDGIRRLAAYKRERGSAYPRIDVNSVGFRHHVNSLPAFVRMMGEAGVNLIHVKPLQVSNQIPFLEPFVAAYRPSIEGKIIEEATAVAKELGVLLGVEVFKRNMIPDDAKVEDFVKSRRAPKGDEIREKYADFGVESVIEFKDLASSIKSRSAEGKQVELKNVARAKPVPLVMKQYNLATPCFEPFKNIYIHVNGDIKPCCFSKHATLGNVFDDGLDVWGNAPFTQFREGVLKGEYPKMCEDCIRVNNAPAKHNVNSVVAQYSKWYQQVFGIPFSPEAQTGAKSLPDNSCINNVWKDKSKPNKMNIG